MLVLKLSSVVALEGREGEPGGVVFLESGHFVVLSQPDFDRIASKLAQTKEDLIPFVDATVSVGFISEG